jgi:sigma-B regulation protein RsbU (phosphoserine phosphatase)
LLTRIANLTKRLIDYRTFGILLLNEEAGELEMKVAVSYGDAERMRRVQLGVGLVGYSALHKEAVLVPDVSKDPRYINVVDDARSELVIPLMLKDRCIGVFDLESPELDAFTKNHVEIPDAARQPGGGRDRERAPLRDHPRQRGPARKGDPFRAACPGGAAATELPKRLKGVSVAARFDPARGLGGDLYDFLAPEPNSLVVAVGDVSGKGRSSCALQRVRGGADSDRARSAGATRQSGSRRRESWPRPTRSCTNASSRSTTAPSATRSSISSGET